MWHAVGRGNTTAEADDGKVCEEYALFKGEGDVFLKGTGFPLVRRLGEVHSKHPGGINSTTYQLDSASKFLRLIISVDIILNMVALIIHCKLKSSLLDPKMGLFR